MLPASNDPQVGAEEVPAGLVGHLEAAARAILVNEGLEIVRKLPLGGSFEVRTSAGLGSIAVAERLRTLDRVIDATPNIWREVAKR